MPINFVEKIATLFIVFFFLGALAMPCQVVETFA